MNLFRRFDLICKLPLTGTQRFVLMRLFQYAGDSNEAYPTQETLASDVVIAPRNLRTHLKAIEGAGFVIKTAPARWHAPSKYSLDWKAIEKAAEGMPASTLKVENKDADLHVCSKQADRPNDHETGCQHPPSGQHSSTKSPSSGRIKRAVRPDDARIQGGCQHPTEHPLTPQNTKKGARRNPLSSLRDFEIKKLGLGRALERFNECLEAGIVKMDDRINFLTLWVFCKKKRDRKPVAAFRACLSRKPMPDWRGDHRDEQAAVDWLKQHDRAAAEVDRAGRTLPMLDTLVEAMRPDAAILAEVDHLEEMGAFDE